jgi:hypothetical protein
MTTNPNARVRRIAHDDLLLKVDPPPMTIVHGDDDAVAAAAEAADARARRVIARPPSDLVQAMRPTSMTNPCL